MRIPRQRKECDFTSDPSWTVIWSNKGVGGTSVTLCRVFYRCCQQQQQQKSLWVILPQVWNFFMHVYLEIESISINHCFIYGFSLAQRSLHTSPPTSFSVSNCHATPINDRSRWFMTLAVLHFESCINTQIMCLYGAIWIFCEVAIIRRKCKAQDWCRACNLERA